MSGPRFFVMMSSQGGTAIQPLVDDDGDVMLWDTIEEAREVARANLWCQSFGYEVFERGGGLT